MIINTTKGSFFNQEIYFADGFIENPYYSEDLADCLNTSKYVSYSNKCNYFYVGSDQLFGENFLEGMNHASLLKFVYSCKFKFLYWTSFGNTKYSNGKSLTKRMSYLLSRFKEIAVRETAGVDLLQKKFGIDEQMHIVDSVFLVDPIIFHKMAAAGKKYRIGVNELVGAYFLDPSDIKKKILKKMVIEKKLKDTVILDRETYTYKDYKEEMHVLKDPRAKEWLALIRESDLFLTDSFHRICFALIFQNEFYVLFEKDNWRGMKRISEFFGKIELSDRLIILEEGVMLICATINCKDVKDKIEKK